MKKLTINEEANLLKAFGNFLRKAEKPRTVLPKRKFMVLDPAGVLAVVGKTEDAKRFLLRFMEKGDNLNYYPKKGFDFSKEGRSCYAYDYLKEIFNVFKAMRVEKLHFEMGKDMPMKIEDENFELILAPRVEND